MKLLLIFILTSMSVVDTLGQTVINRSVIGVGSATGQSNDLIVTATYGQSVVSTQGHNSIIITQGFQQPDDPQISSVRDPGIAYYDVKVYPNPTTNDVLISLPHEISEDLEVGIVDALGRKYKLNWSRQINLMHAELGSLTSGTYHLILTNEKIKMRQSHPLIVLER